MEVVGLRVVNSAEAREKLAEVDGRRVVFFVDGTSKRIESWFREEELKDGGAAREANVERDGIKVRRRVAEKTMREAFSEDRLRGVDNSVVSAGSVDESVEMDGGYVDPFVKWKPVDFVERKGKREDGTDDLTGGDLDFVVRIFTGEWIVMFFFRSTIGLRRCDS